MSKVIAVRKNSDDSIKEYKLDDGRILNAEEIVTATGNGEIDGV